MNSDISRPAQAGHGISFAESFLVMAITAHGLSGYLDNATRVLDEGGPRHLILRVLQKLCSPVLEFGSISFFMCELHGGLPEPSNAFQLRLILPQDLNLLEGFHPEKSAQTFRERFQRGDLCFAALDANGKVAHTRWVTVEKTYIPEIGRYVVLPPGEAYFYDGYTQPDLRRRGIDGAMRGFIFKTMRAAGYRKIYSYVRGDNPIGLKAARRWQQPVGRLWYLRLRGLSPLVIRRGSPDLPTMIRRGTAERKRDERLARARVWRKFFESWLGEPPAKRSTGCYSLPEEYFISTAQYLSSVLDLDPNSDVVLDVGCDSAMVSRLLAPRCRGFVGVDFVPGMLADIPRDAVKSAPGEPASFVAADGRSLPFGSRVFTKAYCAAVLHTLPSHADGLKMVEELVRVCRPGGRVLVAAVPDTAKHLRGYWELWQRAGVVEKARLAISLVMPRAAKDTLRRLLGLSQDRLIFLEYDFGELKRRLEAQGLQCQVLDFPDSYWSRDFRKTRSNLLVRIPPRKSAKVVLKSISGNPHLSRQRTAHCGD